MVIIKRTKAYYLEKISEYFDSYLAENEDIVADIESLAVYIGVTRGELLELENDKKLRREIIMARERIAMIKKQLAFKGKIPAAVLAFDLKNNHGYRDKADCEQPAGNTLIITGEARNWSG